MYKQIPYVVYPLLAEFLTQPLYRQDPTS
jgi:hypothetical protein